jgi:hypothetical protein
MPNAIIRPASFGGGAAAPALPGDRPARAASARLTAILWSRIAGTDPGLLRLLLAMRGTLSVGLTACVLTACVLAAVAGAFGRPITEFAFGVVLSMVGPFLMRDPTRRQRLTTLLLLLLPAAAVAVAASVLLGMIYGMLGTPLEQLLLLRLEETAIGVLAAGLAASFVLPTPTRHQVRLSGLQVLRSLRAVAQSSLAAMEGGPRLAPIEAVRRLDRQIGDLRLAFVPLSAGRFIMRRARTERPLTAMLACADAARALAAAATNSTANGDLPALRGRLAAVEAQIAAILSNGRAPRFHRSAEIADDPAGQALRRLDLALAMLSERLADNLLDGFAVD